MTFNEAFGYRLEAAFTTLNARVSHALGVPVDGTTTMASPGRGSSECWQNCTAPCPNATSACLCPCVRDLDSDPSLGAAFASVSFLFFLVATVQLILCMAHDALHSHNTLLVTEAREEKWRKAFRLTVQKSLLGAIIGATGTRGIYYTVRGHIEEKWADILLHVYYPALLSAFSLLILFWAEIFYQTRPTTENHVFLKKHKYSFTFFSFNALVYLLLLAEVVATPLVHDDSEQVRKSGIIGIIFAVLLLMMLVAFLHLAIRLFFRPDWQPLVLQLEALKINLKQHTLSCLGIVTNALMQALIIALLVFNMVTRFKPMDNYSMYVASIVIRVTELVMPVWFCCSLWNYKKPSNLWILNPGLLIQQLDLGGTERERLVRTGDTNSSGYGSIEGSHSSEEGYCWVCHDKSPTADLIQPCRCQLHRQCIQKWVMHRASNSNVSRKEVFKCQVCRKKYYTKKRRCVCLPQGLSRKHLVQGSAIFLFLVLSGLALYCVLAYARISSSVKLAIVAVLVLVVAALLKLLGCGLIWIGRKHRAAIAEITNRPSALSCPRSASNDVTPNDTSPNRTRVTVISTSAVLYRVASPAPSLTSSSDSDVMSHDSHMLTTNTRTDNGPSEPRSVSIHIDTQQRT